MTYDEVIEYYGTAYRAAIENDLSTSTTSHWKRNGFIPIRSQLLLESNTSGALKADLKHYKKGSLIKQRGDKR